MHSSSLSGIGLGLRRALASDLLNAPEASAPSFLEFAPENWMQIGGHWRKVFRELAERYTFTTHGLSLSLGSPEPLDLDFLQGLKDFFDEFPVALYTEHLSFAKCDNAHLHELLPIPFREDAVMHVVQRIRQVQDFLERPIAIENVSYYTPVAAELTESEFINAVVSESGCGLLLDVNNVFVNGFNHKYDPYEFLSSLPLDKVRYCHMAGHELRTPDLIIDTHGDPIVQPVFDLFQWVLPQIPRVPVLLERDFGIPSLQNLQGELNTLRALYNEHALPKGCEPTAGNGSGMMRKADYSGNFRSVSVQM